MHHSVLNFYLKPAYNRQSIRVVVAQMPGPIFVNDHVQLCNKCCPDFILARCLAQISAGTTSGAIMTHIFL